MPLQLSKKRKQKIIELLAILLVAYLIYFGLPPYSTHSNFYPGKVNPELNKEIRLRMAEIRKKYPNPKIEKEVSLWISRGRTNVGWKGYKGISSIPYIEERTRNRDERIRGSAYEMLGFIRHAQVCSASTEKEEKNANEFCDKYIAPINQRGLKDPDSTIRRGNLYEFEFETLRSRGFWSVWTMLRDPDLEVRVEAARTMSGYGYPYLVPIRLHLISRVWEVR